MTAEKAVDMRGIVKIYPGGTVALRGVDFDLRKGEIHCLLGENGAGKTTLMKILAGCLKPDKGEIHLNNKPVKIRTPIDAARLGIGMVHQHFTLIPVFSVAENIILGYPHREKSGYKLDLEKLENEIRGFSESVGLPVDPSAKVAELPAGIKQRVEILRLLYRRAQILILDEPTSVLTPLETEELFKALRIMKSEGKSVVIVTHKLYEALSIGDRITVLRKGRVVARIDDPTTVSEAELAEYVVGEKVITKAEKKPKKSREGEAALSVKGLHVVDDRGVEVVRGVSLNVRLGEIYGLAGVVGNGQRELVEALVGLRKPIKGSIFLFGKDVTQLSVKERILNGVAYIPEERLVRGVAGELSLAENLIVKLYDKEPFVRKKVFLDFKRIKEFAEEAVKKYNIMTPGINAPVSFMSGGNIQKLIIARELLGMPKLVIAEQPTAGLDVKATEFVHEKLMDLRNAGVAIFLVSADLDEILTLSDRVGVIYGGRIVKEYERIKDIELRELSEYMLGVKEA